MQLEQINIQNLFGRFSYNIKLRRLEKITIIHAPNGFGKTVILTLVNAFFSRQFMTFFKYQFDELTLTFDNGEGVVIRRLGESSLPLEIQPEDTLEEIQISLISRSQTPDPFTLRAGRSIPPLNRILPFIEPLGPDRWLDENTGEAITTNEVISRYEAHLPVSVRKRADLPQWLATLTQSVECRLIETQRLLRISRPEESYRPQRRPITTNAVVDVEASDLATRIGATLAEYANRSQSLDQSFPRRVIIALASTAVPDADEISHRLREVDEKRSFLIEAGLLDQSGAPEILSQAELLGREVRQVIGVYLDDMEQKLSRFDQLYQRVSLFKEILSEKFQFKSIVVSREKGISVRTDRGRDIPLRDLSSGEQHELVLLYELLFGVSDDALILIDEPELSLHVGWQVKFIPDLQRIQKLRPFQIIMATHSPQIINDRWDLTEELSSVPTLSAAITASH